MTGEAKGIDIPDGLVLAFAQALRDATPGAHEGPITSDGPFADMVRRALPVALASLLSLGWTPPTPLTRPGWENS